MRTAARTDEKEEGGAEEKVVWIVETLSEELKESQKFIDHILYLRTEIYVKKICVKKICVKEVYI